MMCCMSVYCRTLYNQLVQESSAEKFSERRVNLLKAQVYQLERQVSGCYDTQGHMIPPLLHRLFSSLSLSTVGHH